MPGYAKDLAKFDQFTDGQGTNNQLEIQVLIICYLNLKKKIFFF